jgi:hypothetical protein
MTWRTYLLLVVLGLTVATVMAMFQATPGYMDADAYFIGGRQLAMGKGFTEPFLWNYLDNPAGIPHPSNAYWMPLASLLAATGTVLLGSASWSAARLGFLVVASCLPPLTAALSWSFNGRRDLSITSGLLAVFPAFYLPFLPVTDTFGIYILLGGIFFLLLSRSTSLIPHKSPLITSFFLGVISGLMHLSRADGLLWLLLAMTAIIILFPNTSNHRSRNSFFAVMLTLAGYLIIMLPWFIRNISAFGTILAPGGVKMLWLTSYDQIFTFPASQLTAASWWKSGLVAILKVRVWSLGLNLATTLAVQGEVFLIPLIGFGFWYMRKDRRVLLAGVAWLLTLGVMTIVFPFAGARGSFFHSGAALQTVLWVLAPQGLERIVLWGCRKRGWIADQAGNIFRMGLIGLAVMITAAILWSRGLGGIAHQAWDQENIAYSHISEYLVSQGAASGDVVMVANPPGFFLASGNPSIAVPDGDVGSVLTAARKYNAHYLVLETGSTPRGLLPLFTDPKGQSGLIYMNEIEHARIFLVDQQ